jgi:hypothetical protein
MESDGRLDRAKHLHERMKWILVVLYARTALTETSLPACFRYVLEELLDKVETLQGMSLYRITRPPVAPAGCPASSRPREDGDPAPNPGPRAV